MTKLSATRILQLVAVAVAVAVVASPVAGAIGDKDTGNGLFASASNGDAEASIESVYDLDKLFYSNPNPQTESFKRVLQYNIDNIGLDGDFYVEVEDFGHHKCSTSAEAAEYITGFKKVHTATIYDGNDQLCSQEYILYEREITAVVETVVIAPVSVSKGADVDAQVTLTWGDKQFSMDEYVYCEALGGNKIKVTTSDCISDLLVMLCSTMDHSIDITLSVSGTTFDCTLGIDKTVDVSNKQKNTTFSGAFLGRGDVFKVGNEFVTMSMTAGGVIIHNDWYKPLSEVVNMYRNYPDGTLQIYYGNEEFIFLALYDVDSAQADIIVYMLKILEHI